MSAECKRGDLYIVNWNPGKGSEQTGKRPALIIQNDTGNKYSPTTIVAVCSAARAKPYPFIVGITAGESGLDRDSTINLSQIMTIDKARLEMKLGQLSAAKMDAIDEAIKHSLGISL
jgi:mRNA interferase MazF